MFIIPVAGLAKAAIAAKADGEWIDLSRPLGHDTRLQIVVPDSDDGREVLRHSTAHVMAEAVTRLFPGAKVAIGPAIADGFYYDFDLPDGATFSDDDLERIEAEMRTIVKADQTVLSVAAASVVAKTTRDAMMAAEAEHYPAYGFETNRGYPAPVHKCALAAYGPSAIHRRSWIFMDGCLWGGIARFERQPSLFTVPAR